MMILTYIVALTCFEIYVAKDKQFGVNITKSF